MYLLLKSKLISFYEKNLPFVNFPILANEDINLLAYIIIHLQQQNCY